MNPWEVHLYSARATGCKVVSATGTVDTRKCVTTRKDGHITLKLGMNGTVPSYWVGTSKPLPTLIPRPNFGSLFAGK